MKDPEKAKRIPAVVKGIAAMSDGQFQNFLSGNREIMRHCGEEVYLQYWGRHCTIQGELNLPEEGEFLVRMRLNSCADKWKTILCTPGRIRICAQAVCIYIM